jgi:hypothetical protein
MTGNSADRRRVSFGLLQLQRIVLWWCCCCCIIIVNPNKYVAVALIPQQRQPQHQQQGGSGSGSHWHWQIHRAIQQLQTDGMPSSSSSNDNNNKVDFTSTTADVIQVLQLWANDYAGKDEWRSLLNKRSLRHEIEESIVALHHLREWRQQTLSQSTTTTTGSDSFVAVDACCGKGVFSMLLSYMAALQGGQAFTGLSRIILLDKNEGINWDHIQAANANHTQEKRPFLELWPGTNLHEHDIITERLLLASDSTSATTKANNDAASISTSTSTPLAITGIHLCKTLSPTLVGIVNALGKEKVPYLCIAPCCLPRTRHQQLSIPLYESPLQRQARMIAAKTKREQRQSFACFVCEGNHHVRGCPQRATYATELEWDQAVEAGVLRRQVPCWKCGQVGHRQGGCTVDPSLAASVDQVEQPRMLWDFGSVVTATLDNQQPFKAYCDALSKLVQQTSTVQVLDSGLISSSSALHNKEIQSQENNWNQNRKSLFITVTR